MVGKPYEAFHGQTELRVMSKPGAVTLNVGGIYVALHPQEAHKLGRELIRSAENTVPSVRDLYLGLLERMRQEEDAVSNDCE